MAIATGLAAQGPPQQGPVIIPKAAPQTTTPTPPPPPPQAAPQEKPQYNLTVSVPDVEVPVSVQTQDGQFVPNLTKEHFSVWEDGVPQKIDKLSISTDAPMTVVMLVEFRQEWIGMLQQIMQASYVFTGQLQPQDWVALVTYDLKPTIVVDFTHDRNAIVSGLNSLHFADFREADLFDSLSDTLDRMDSLQGRKTIVLISTGLNTFSSLTFDKLRKKLAQTQGVTIYGVSMSWVLQQNLNGIGYQQQMASLAYLQADNELRAIAESTGGQFYQPRFEGAFNEVFHQIASSVRTQYVVSYTPTNKKLDGTVRKVKVELVGNNGEPLKMVDAKGKTIKYDLTYRTQYTARHIVE